MPKRQSKKLVQVVTNEQFEAALSDYAATDARATELNARLNREINCLREQYATELKALQKTCEDSFNIVQSYCQEHQERLFLKKKSMETVYGTIGFRSGTPKLKTMKGFTWTAALELVKIKLPDYVRRTEEIDKAGLLADRDSQAVAPLLHEAGIMIDKEERFFIELKKEETIAA